MAYPLPPELSAKIYAFLESQGFDLETQETAHDWIAMLLVRQNRMVRQGIAELKRNFLEAAEREEMDHNGATAAYAGEETCQHILDNILKPNVYFNSEEAEARQAAVEDFIEKFYRDEDSVPE